MQWPCQAIKLDFGKEMGGNWLDLTLVAANCDDFRHLAPSRQRRLFLFSRQTARLNAYRPRSLR
jgi:hypothetical protein